MADKKDLTRIEDLSEYLHQEDTAVNKILGDFPPKAPSGVDELDELPPTPMEEDVSEFDYSSDDHVDEVEAVDVSAVAQNKTEEFGPSGSNDFATSKPEESEESEESEEFSSSFDSSFGDTDEESNTFETDFNSKEDDTPFETEESTEDSGDFSLSEDASFEASPFEADNFESAVEIEDEPVVEEEVLFEPEPEPAVEEEVLFEAEPEPESKVEYAAPSPDYQPETFSDVKKFAQSVTYGVMAQEGSPPFSVMLRNIKFKEDCDDIFLILKDHGLITPDSEGDIKTGLDHGSLLVSQLSEFCAIFLAHKLRRFDLEIQIGLSDELHPSKSYARGEMGPINKTALMQNREESFSKSETPVDLKSVLLATVPNLEGYKVLRYLGITSEHALIKESELSNFDDENTVGVDVGETYNSLSEKLKLKALKKGGNAVLNVNYQFSPLPNIGEASGETIYKVTCTGNAVWVTDSGV